MLLEGLLEFISSSELNPDNFVVVEFVFVLNLKVGREEYKVILK